MKGFALAALAAAMLCLGGSMAPGEAPAVKGPPPDISREAAAAVCRRYIKDCFRAQLYGVPPSLREMELGSLIRQYCGEKLERYVQGARYRPLPAYRLKIEYSFGEPRRQGEDLLVAVRVRIVYSGSRRGDQFHFRLTPAPRGWTITDVFSQGDLADQFHRNLPWEVDIAANRITQREVDGIRLVTGTRAWSRVERRQQPPPPQGRPWDLCPARAPFVCRETVLEGGSP